MAEWFHLFPFRTQQLSTHTPKVLRWRRRGRLGIRRLIIESTLDAVFKVDCAKMAALVKWLTRRIVAPICVGSIPTSRPRQGYSSIGRATVSKTVGCEFNSYCPCHFENQTAFLMICQDYGKCIGRVASGIAGKYGLGKGSSCFKDNVRFLVTSRRRARAVIGCPRFA